MKLSPFHLAIPVKDVEKCRTFYRDILGCDEGRSSDKWVDFNFFGHQFVIHESPFEKENKIENTVDGHAVPVPHFGVILPWEEFEVFSEHLKSKKIDFIIEPYVRFKGQVGEQATLFFYDPAGNALEFKAFRDTAQIFAK